MRVVYQGERLEAPGGSVVAVGTFDGVHVGHQALLRQTRGLAADAHLPSVAAVFDRHPASVVRPEAAPRLLTTTHQRLELLAELELDVCYVIRFDEERSLQEPEEFIREVLVDTLCCRTVVVGPNFHFGRKRHGDSASLARLAPQYDITVVIPDFVGVEERPGPVSSGAIREVLAQGDVELAAAMLGRRHEARGVVEHGDNRGRSIGFPTANVAVAGDSMLPCDGVYAGCYYRPDGVGRPAAINLGRRPTFYDETGLRLLEAHLLDFDDDLYGEPARVQFGKWLRGEVRFASVDDLVAQMGRDVEITRRYLA
ncbi:MAG TPA: bifunctional riboflavin kinase/FAD synthetase [Acidimicrobiales bacterium]|nr:bifunctional riboflavin kinase/FAD synthetase [Acidimicrobiales bacterium]